MTVDNELSGTLLTPDAARIVVARFFKRDLVVTDGILDLYGFFKLVYEMLKVDQPSYIFAPSYPKYLRVGTPDFQATFKNPTELFKPTITWSINRMEPATLGGDGQMFGTGTKQLAPRPMVRQGLADDKQRMVYLQSFDVEVKFELWFLTNFEAEQGVEWFRQYMTDRRPFLKAQGINEIHFWNRKADQAAQPYDNVLEKRPLTFYVRTQEVSTSETPILKNLEFSTTII